MVNFQSNTCCVPTTKQHLWKTYHQSTNTRYKSVNNLNDKSTRRTKKKINRPKLSCRVLETKPNKESKLKWKKDHRVDKSLTNTKTRYINQRN